MVLLKLSLTKQSRRNFQYMAINAFFDFQPLPQLSTGLMNTIFLIKENYFESLLIRTL